MNEFDGKMEDRRVEVDIESDRHRQDEIQNSEVY